MLVPVLADIYANDGDRRARSGNSGLGGHGRVAEVNGSLDNGCLIGRLHAHHGVWWDRQWKRIVTSQFMCIARSAQRVPKGIVNSRYIIHSAIPPPIPATSHSKKRYAIPKIFAEEA